METLQGCFTNLHTEELHKLYSLFYIIIFIKLSRTWWSGCGEGIWEKTNACDVQV